MPRITFSPSGIAMRGNNSGDDFSYSVLETPVGTFGGTSTTTVHDATIIATTTNAGLNNAVLNVHKSIQNPRSDLSFRSLTPSIATIDSGGNIAYVSDGTASFAVKSGGIEKQFSRVMSHSGNVITSVTQSYQSGSLGASVSAACDALIAGLTAQASYPIPGNQNIWLSNNDDPLNPVASRNPSFFAASISHSFSFIGSANVQGTTDVYQHPAILVTQRHILGAHHYQTSGGQIGAPVSFMKNDGSGFVTAYIKATWSDPESDDHWIAYLDQAVTGVTPVKVMPSGWKSYLKSLDTAVGGYTGTVPLLCRVMHDPAGNFENRVSVMELNAVQSGPSDWILVGQPGGSSARFPWSGTIRGGDSGGPIMMAVSGSAVLLATFFTASGGYSIEHDSAEMEAAMNSIKDGSDGTTYSFSRADLSGFTAY